MTEGSRSTILSTSRPTSTLIAKVSRPLKVFLLVLGTLSALLIVSQLVMGQLILSGQAEWIKRHQHSGYLTVVVALLYIVFSLRAIAAIPPRDRG